jgi:hypothetical protein
MAARVVAEEMVLSLQTIQRRRFVRFMRMM